MMPPPPPLIDALITMLMPRLLIAAIDAAAIIATSLLRHAAMPFISMLFIASLVALPAAFFACFCRCFAFAMIAYADDYYCCHDDAII